MKKIIICFTAGILCMIMSVVYTNSVMADLSEHLLRLHIIANSDSSIDQEVKLKVRDAVIAKARANNSLSLEEITDTANRVLSEHEFSYSAKAEYGTFHFPKKEYANITLPQGWYSGVRIVLGNGSGQNWWCVMYPPLCFTQEVTGELDDSGKNQLTAALENESLELISQKDNVDIEMKFKIVEIMQNLINK